MFSPANIFKFSLVSIPLALILTFSSQYFWSSSEAQHVPPCVGDQTLTDIPDCTQEQSAIQKGYPFAFVASTKTATAVGGNYSNLKIQQSNSFDMNAFVRSFAAWFVLSFIGVVALRAAVHGAKKRWLSQIKVRTSATIPY